MAFDETPELEANALRALFRSYRDIRSNRHITAKIFLRSDIWERITEIGFREATHLSRDIALRWDKPTLKNLIIQRLLNNPKLIEFYGVDRDRVIGSVARQEEVFDKVFPDQIEVGEKQSTTLDWMLRRTADGSGQVQPRDVIMFLNALAAIQNRRLERGEQEPPDTFLFDRASFKDALLALSEYKLVRGLFAEYPSLRRYMDALRAQKNRAKRRVVVSPLECSASRSTQDCTRIEGNRVLRGAGI